MQKIGEHAVEMLEEKGLRDYGVLWAGRIVAASEGYTVAQVTDLCIKIAEKKFWEAQ